MSTVLNGFQIKFSAEAFTAFVTDLPDTSGLKELRQELGTDWFTHWDSGNLWGIPRVPEPATPLGRAEKLPVEKHLRLLTARINDVLPVVFPKYGAFRHHPFSFIGKRDEIVQLIRRNLSGLPDILQKFKVRPKFELDSKIIELRDNEVGIGMFLNIGTRWEILASLKELVESGVDLTGLYVVRRESQPGMRRLVGRIGGFSDDSVCLAESYDDQSAVSQDEVWLEGSRMSFARCLKRLLGLKYDSFENQRAIEEANLLTGPGFDQVLTRMNEVLHKASPMRLTSDLECSVSGRITVANTDGYQSVVSSGPVVYCYDAAKTKRDEYAWRGLAKFGPFSRESFSKKTPRILVVFPDNAQGQVEQFLKQFRDGIVSLDKSYYRGGFAATFGLVNPEFVYCIVPWMHARNASIVDVYRKEMEDLLARDKAGFDLAFIVVPDQQAFLPDPENPYLHTKALLFMAGIPVQEARLSTLTAPAASLQYTLQNIAIAAYAKMGGVPWTVDQDLTVNDELVIGIGTCELSGSRFLEKQRHVGITTVFRGDGNYLLANLSSECSYDKYPEVLKASTTEILREVKQRNGWRPGDTVRIVFHAQKPLKNVEVDHIVANCVQEVGHEQNVQFAFLTVSFDHPFTVFDTEQPGIEKYGKRKAVYVPDRGTIVQLGRYTRLVCTTGPYLVKREVTPMPDPLLVHLHKQSTYRDLSYLAEQVLKFTSLSWRSTLPASKPVTIYYSELIARLLARLHAVPGWSPTMLNVKLRASRWFL